MEKFPNDLTEKVDFCYEMKGAIDEVLNGLTKINVNSESRKKAIELTKNRLVEIRNELTDELRDWFCNERNVEGELYYAICSFCSYRKEKHYFTLYIKEDVLKLKAGKYETFIYPAVEGIAPGYLKIPATLYVGDYRMVECFEQNAEYILHFYPNCYFASRDGNQWKFVNASDEDLWHIIRL